MCAFPFWYNLNNFYAVFISYMLSSRRDASELPQAPLAASKLRGGRQGQAGERQAQPEGQLWAAAAATAAQTEAWRRGEENGRAAAGVLGSCRHDPELAAAAAVVHKHHSRVVVKATHQTGIKSFKPFFSLRNRENGEISNG